MPWARKRPGTDGGANYTAYYRDTTQKYLHALPDADDRALNAFQRTRGRGRGTS
jgi:hypothetical protein